ncbi:MULTISPECIES: L,D-transpeptidase [unclassified Xanthobacter]|uniref:L,D-transpeptidase n=1 Tax=unclassified Xanthobacter TaxID=2623496 RepID=UPI001EDFB61E|nr:MULTISPECIES: L,D-transpeptidase [unclassified Xanthobacter]
MSVDSPSVPAPSSRPKLAHGFSRRRFLQLGMALSGGVALDALWPVQAADDPDLAAIAALKPGQYVWHPERAPEGFVAVVVNLDDQRAYVYRNGVRIGVSTVSTGREGHDTPTGVFTILGKDADHHSSIYNNASMPFTERLTWSGVALHAGGLPGYPSSHGCVHLPLAFAKELFSITHVGTPVIIADNHTAPQDVLHPGLIMSEGLEQELAVNATGAGAPEDMAAAETAVAMVASAADKSLTVLRGGQVVLQGPIAISDPSAPLGNVVYVLASRDGTPRWSAISYEGNAAPAGEAAQALARITVDPSINRQVASLMHPGATLLVTDLPAHPGTRTGRDFVVLTHKMVS